MNALHSLTVLACR